MKSIACYNFELSRLRSRLRTFFESFRFQRWELSLHFVKSFIEYYVSWQIDFCASFITSFSFQIVWWWSCLFTVAVFANKNFLSQINNNFEWFIPIKKILKSKDKADLSLKKSTSTIQSYFFALETYNFRLILRISRSYRKNSLFLLTLVHYRRCLEIFMELSVTLTFSQ